MDFVSRPQRCVWAKPQSVMDFIIEEDYNRWVRYRDLAVFPG